MNILGSLMLTGASIAPILFVYAAMTALNGKCITTLILVLIGVILFILGILLLSQFKKHLEKSDEEFTSVEVADRESIGMLVLYVLPLLRTPSPNTDYVILIPAVAIFIAMALTGIGYHFNPLLNLLGWHFYKVGTAQKVTYILVTKKKIINVNHRFTVGKLTTHTVIDME